VLTLVPGVDEGDSVTDERSSISLQLFELSASSLTRVGSVPVVPPLPLVECLALFGYPTDPDSVAIVEPTPRSS
jgi:hypothetical protein